MTVRVLSPMRQPIAGAQVICSECGAQSVVTDVAGRGSFTRPSSGRVHLRVEHPRWGSTDLTCAVQAEVEVTLEALCSVRGELLRNGPQDRVVGIRVATVANGGPLPAPPVVTFERKVQRNKDRYVISGLVPARHNVFYTTLEGTIQREVAFSRNGQEVEVNVDGSVVSGQNEEFELAGTMLRAQEPLRDTYVRWSLVGTHVKGGGAIQTDANGQFRLRCHGSLRDSSMLFRAESVVDEILDLRKTARLDNVIIEFDAADVTRHVLVDCSGKPLAHSLSITGTGERRPLRSRASVEVRSDTLEVEVRLQEVPALQGEPSRLRFTEHVTHFYRLASESNNCLATPGKSMVVEIWQEGEFRRWHSQMLLGVRLPNQTVYSWVSFFAVQGGAYLCNLPPRGEAIVLATRFRSPLVGWFARFQLEDVVGGEEALVLDERHQVSQRSLPLKLPAAGLDGVSVRLGMADAKASNLPAVLNRALVRGFWLLESDPEPTISYPLLPDLTLTLGVTGYSAQVSSSTDAVEFTPVRTLACRLLPRTKSGIAISASDASGRVDRVWCPPSGALELSRDMRLPIALVASYSGQDFYIGDVTEQSGQVELRLPSDLVAEMQRSRVRRR